MSKRFRTKKHSNIKYIFISIIVIILLIKITIHIIKKYYLDNIINQEFITEMLETTNYNKYLDPIYILEYTTNYKETEPAINNIEPSIYIYTTHETENYSSNSLEAYNITPNIKLAASILKDKLNDYNIIADLETTSITDILKNNNWSYGYSYIASRQVIEDKIHNNNYRLIIDLHRDSSSINKTQITYNNTNYAKVLFVIGTEYNYDNNYNVANKLSNILNNKIPEISRGIITKGGEGVNGVYNQDINPNMILIEVGGSYNNIEDINNTMDILAISIKEYLEGEQ